jgi:hypothetical protein
MIFEVNDLSAEEKTKIHANKILSEALDDSYEYKEVPYEISFNEDGSIVVGERTIPLNNDVI